MEHTTQWVRLRYGPGQIEARLNDGKVEARSLADGEPCTFEHVQRNIIIEDNRRSICISVAAAIAEEDEDLRHQLSDSTVEMIDYSYIQLQGKAAVILLQAARAFAGDHVRKLDDLTRTSWADLVKMIPGGLDNYEP